MDESTVTTTTASTSSAATTDGGCQCGAVRFALSGTPIMTALCHCSMCRKAHAAPAVAWAMYAESQLRWTLGQPKGYASSADGLRGFCAECGTQLTFTASYLPDMVDVAIGSLDEPGHMPPQFQYWYDDHLAWLADAADLPKFAEFPPSPDDQ